MSALGSTGWRSSDRDQRYHQTRGDRLGSPGLDWLIRRRSLRLSTRWPKKPSSAGSRVREASMVSATVTVAATAAP